MQLCVLTALTFHWNTLGQLRMACSYTGLKCKIRNSIKQLVNSLSHIALDAGINLIPVYTNIRDFLGRDWSFWGTEIQGAVLAGVAHAFSRRLTTVTIPSSFDIAHLYPFGSHSLLDPNYSSIANSARQHFVNKVRQNQVSS